MGRRLPPPNFEGPIVRTVELRKPIGPAGYPVAALGLRRPLAGDLEALDGLAGVASDLVLAERLSRLPVAQLRTMTGRDSLRVSKELRTLIVASSVLPEGLEAAPEATEDALELAAPVGRPGREHRVLTFREPTAGDLEACEAAGGGVAADLEMMARLTGVEIHWLRRLELYDFVRAQQVVQGLLLESDGG